MKPRISESWRTLSRRTGLPGSSSSSMTLMKEQPSKSSRANHSPKTSKIASSRCAGVAARLSTVSCSQPRVQRSSRSSRKARMRSSLEAKLR